MFSCRILPYDKAPSEATFRGAEFLSYDLTQTGGEPIVSTQDALTLYFKTRQPNGLLFYTGHGADYLNLAVRDGGVSLTMGLGNGKQEMHIKPAKTRFDDHQWHKLTVHRRVQEITPMTSFCRVSAIVDDVYSDHSHVAGSFTMLASSRAHVGGSLNARALPGARVHTNFIGCLKKVEFSADTLRLNLIDLARTGSKLITVTGRLEYACSATDSGDPVTFTTRDAHLILPKWEAVKTGTISFKFRTNEPNGLILYNAGEKPPRADLFAVEVLSGHIYVHIDLGSGGVRVKASKKKVDDSKWHEFLLRRSGKDGRVTVDGANVEFKTPGESNQLELDGPLFVGGLGSEYAASRTSPALYTAALRQGFVGCVRELVLNGKPQDLTAYARQQDSASVRAACHVLLNQCVSSPCQHGGVCTEGWNRALCDCSSTNYGGTNMWTRKDKINPLLAKSNKIKIHDEVIPVDPLLLFQRICVLKKTDEELKNYMNYELAPYPLALFENGELRKTKKSTFYELFPELSINLKSLENVHYIIDGGMLLHRCKWQLNESFKMICEHYVRYLKNNYNSNVYVVFDGYKIDSIKSDERNRRALKNKCADIEFNADMPLKIAQDKFLSNNNNKSRLIDMLRIKLADNNIFTCQAESDADKLIVDTAINLETKNVVIVSEDIDVLVILTALANESREIYFLKPSRDKVKQKIFSSKSLEKSLPKCKEHILFLHSLTGCDTTSAFFNKGKIKFAKNFEKHHDLHEFAKIFKNKNEDFNNIFQAGVACILALYGAPAKIKDLNTLRYNFFIKATTKNTSVILSSLPPTTDAAIEHLKRVYLQTQIWLGNDINIGDWGWKYLNNMFIPITMNQLPAPDNLLQMLFCNCKKGKFTIISLFSFSESPIIYLNGSQHLSASLGPEHVTQTEEFMLRFRTTKPGLLLRTTSETSSDRIELTVAAGRVRAHVRLGERDRNLLAGTNVADDNWHTVKFSRRASNLKLQVDGTQPVRGMLPETILGKSSSLEITTLHLGGLFHSEEEIQMTSTLPNFVGYLQKFVFNGIRYIDMAKSIGIQSSDEHNNIDDTSSIIFTGTFVKPDSLNVYKAVTFKSKHTYVGLPLLKAYANTYLDFYFRTTEMDGLLFYNGGKKQDFIAIELVNGHVHCVFNLGDGVVTLKDKLKNFLNDNRWHTVSVRRPTPKIHTLQVDDDIEMHTT
ncbi:hypothetical protein ACJJTC_005414, partial [Scirpophaga incertulas]